MDFDILIRAHEVVRLEVCLEIKEDGDGKDAIQTFGQREDALGELMREAQRQFNEAVKRRTCYNGARSRTV
jgi:hypothetical protein